MYQLIAPLLFIPLFGTSCSNPTKSEKQESTATNTADERDARIDLPPFQPSDSLPLALNWKVLRDSSASSGGFSKFSAQYTADPENITAFRGGNFRNGASRGSIKGKPTGLKLDWTFKTRTGSVQTGNDGSKYSKINWGGGSGWTGQPSLVKWSRAMKEALKITNPEFVQNDQAREVIIGSLSGEIYFIDFATGKPTRDPYAIDGPIKGSIAIDPRLNGMLYVGQGIPKGKRFGAYLIDMASRKVNLHVNGRDSDAEREWGAFDSSPLLNDSSGTLFWPAENGLIYRINVQDKDRPFVEAKMKYRRSGMNRLGLEASMAAIGSHGFFGDNSGNIICVDLRDMKPVWQIDNEDDIDASIVVDHEESGYYLYVGHEVDHRQPYATAWLKKIDARDGSIVWQVGRECAGHDINGKENSGGILATPLIGKHKGSDIAISIYSRVNRSLKGELVAINKKTGKELYSFKLDNYSWATPTDFYDQEGNMYLFLSDVSGNVYLLNGLTGQLIHKSKSGSYMESSPIIYNDRIIVGTRGNSVISYKILTD
jgi:outer membrane protein assembly factor BamB